MAQQPQLSTNETTSTEIHGLVDDIVKDDEKQNENENGKENSYKNKKRTQSNAKLLHSSNDPMPKTSPKKQHVPSSSLYDNGKLEFTPLSQHIENNEKLNDNKATDDDGGSNDDDHHEEEEENENDDGISRRKHFNRTASLYRVPTTINSTKQEYKKIRKQNASIANGAIVDKEILTSIINDDSRAMRCRLCRFLFVGMMIFSYFGYQLSKYLDSAENTYSTSSLSKINELDAPYVVFQAVSPKITPYFEYIYFSSVNEYIYYKEMDHIQFSFDDDTSSDIDYQNEIYKKFKYNVDTTDWTLIEVNKTTSNNDSNHKTELTSILIPPSDAKISLSDSLYLGIVGVTKQVNASNSVSDESEYVDSFADGLSYGIYWLADSRKQMISTAIDNPIDYMLERFGNNSQYAFSGQLSLIYIDAFETIDKTQRGDAGNEEYYACRIGASHIDYKNAVTNDYCDKWIILNNINDINDYKKHYNDLLYEYNSTYYVCESPSFWTGFYFMPNPSGIKTTITISSLRDIFDVLASVGGIFSPLLTVTGILILYCIWGLDLGRLRIAGLAPTAGFNDYIFERKLDVYLAERGLIITHQQNDEDKQKRATLLNTLM